jgi:hypothetical protein
MNDVDDLTSLAGKLSGAEKDELIARLWRDLQAERVRSSELERRLGPGKNVPQTRPLLERLQQAAAGQRTPRPLRSGESKRWFALTQSRTLVVAVTLVAVAFALDFAVGKYQQYRLQQKRLAEVQLRYAAFQGMFAEVVNVAYEPDHKSYRLTMQFTNAGSPLYVMQSPVRVFEQSGLSWVEIPSRDAQGDEVRVVKLAAPYTLETIFEPNVKEWTELIPGYMHIRFQAESLISERADPDDDVIDRTDRYYVYLKPHGADDDAIRARTKIRGNLPVYMPMPPH